MDLTLSVLKQFGIHILAVENYFYIKGSQRYIPQDAIVEGDYSQAAFFIVAGLLGNEPIQLTHLSKDSLQGDKAILEIVKKMDGHIQFEDETLFVYPSKTKGITIDLKDIPDLGPILMVLSSLSEGQTTFLNGGRLRIKESDRLQAMVDTLTRFGVKIEVSGETVTITGQSKLKGHQTLSAFHDHRIAMAIAIASIKADGPIVIEGAEAINKSYPTFFEDFKRLGGDVQ